MLTNSYVGICHQTVNCFIDFVDITTGAHIVQASYYFTTLPTSHLFTNISVLTSHLLVTPPAAK